MEVLVADQFDLEEEDIERRLEEGHITREEADAEHRELRRDYQGAAEEAAENAYRREMENW